MQVRLTATTTDVLVARVDLAVLPFEGALTCDADKPNNIDATAKRTRLRRVLSTVVIHREYLLPADGDAGGSTCVQAVDDRRVRRVDEVPFGLPGANCVSPNPWTKRPKCAGRVAKCGYPVPVAVVESPAKSNAPTLLVPVAVLSIATVSGIL